MQKIFNDIESLLKQQGGPSGYTILDIDLRELTNDYYNEKPKSDLKDFELGFDMLLFWVEKGIELENNSDELIDFTKELKAIYPGDILNDKFEEIENYSVKSINNVIEEDITIN